ncbi:class I SAM-dependent methyltransferase [Actinopolyspora saharensis]|uniref:class I SAM-dependent methyltransferase n=1 Tax=Actinopolyspora saharensis TaxID=995062 RepID=UPI003F67867C
MALATVFARVFGDDLPIEFRAYDGSRHGPSDCSTAIVLKSPLALGHLASAPGELGLARAYVNGHIEVEGDMYTALAAFPPIRISDIPLRQRIELAVRLGAHRVWWPVSPPAEENRAARGRRHSKSRDSRSISYHYDVSNQFYEWVLGPSMTYTCAVFERQDATLEQAQREKHDLVARKLGLREGMSLLDIGAGWGGMVLHAAENYGVRAIGVTLSEEQADWARHVIAERGLSHLAEVRYQDYRDVPESGFDAISSIGLTEHIGRDQLPGYFRTLRDKLKAGGRLLNHCITRPDGSYPARPGKFIGRYVFPDGELESPAEILGRMNDNGFEVRHEENLREHYALTLAGWCANLDRNWRKAVAEVGPGRARVWRLYMAASRLAFERNEIQLHQTLGVRSDGGVSSMPLRPDW